MSESPGLTKSDKQLLNTVVTERKKHTRDTTHEYDRPDIDEVDNLVEARGNTNKTVHLPDPTQDGLAPWCEGKGGVQSNQDPEWRERRVWVARGWRTPCKVCFPEGFNDD